MPCTCMHDLRGTRLGLGPVQDCMRNMYLRRHIEDHDTCMQDEATGNTYYYNRETQVMLPRENRVLFIFLTPFPCDDRLRAGRGQHRQQTPHRLPPQ